MRLFKVKPSADTEIRIFKCDTCHHEFQLMAWTPLMQDREPVRFTPDQILERPPRPPGNQPIKAAETAENNLLLEEAHRHYKKRA
jgi:hypothetical protein